MQQIQKLQQQMAEAQEKLAAETATATTNGGLGLGIGVGLELPPWRGAGSGGNTPEAPTQAATLQVRTCQWRPWPRRVAVWVRAAGKIQCVTRAAGNAARGRLGPDTGAQCGSRFLGGPGVAGSHLCGGGATGRLVSPGASNCCSSATRSRSGRGYSARVPAARPGSPATR